MEHGCRPYRAPGALCHHSEPCPTRFCARLACLLGVLAASCTSTSAPPPVHSAAPLPGDMLSVTSDQTATSIVRYRPADASVGDDTK